jgi:hypothetical protein
MPKMTLNEFIHHLERTAAWLPVRVDGALQESGRRVQNLAQDYIGDPTTPAVRPFPAWRPLADATVEDRIAKGYAPNETLLREGTLQSSIRHVVVASKLTVYTNNKVGAYQEFGTTGRNPIPPRAFIGRAMAQRGRVEALYVARAAFRPLFDGRS